MRRSEMCFSYIAVQVGVFWVIINPIWNDRLEENEICFQRKMKYRVYNLTFPWKLGKVEDKKTAIVSAL